METINTYCHVTAHFGRALYLTVMEDTWNKRYSLLVTKQFYAEVVMIIERAVKSEVFEFSQVGTLVVGRCC